jgi:Family of unknown function (DUF5343)
MMTDKEPVAGSGKTIPPYVSYRSFKTLVQDLHEQDVPAKIDKDVTRKFSGSVRKQLMTSLRFLELVDKNDAPQDELKELSKAYGTDTWPATLRSLIGAQYAAIFGKIDLATTTPSQIHGAFRDAYGANDAVLKKCEIFFLQSAREAGFPISKRVTIITRQRGPNKVKRSNGRVEEPARDEVSAADKKNRKKAHAHNEHANRDAYRVLVDILDPVAMNDEERKAVFTLIEYLKRREIEDADEQEGEE